MSNEVFRPRKKWLNGNYIGMSEEILEIDWDKLFFGKDIDSCYLIFFDKFQVMRWVRSRNKQSGRTGAPWFTNEIKSIIKQKQKLWYWVKSFFKTLSLRLLQRSFKPHGKITLQIEINKLKLTIYYLQNLTLIQESRKVAY